MPQEELESTALPFRHKPTTMPQEQRDNVVRPFRHRPPTKKSFPVHCNPAALLDPKTELIHRYNQLRELCKWPIPPEKHPMGVLLMKLDEEMQLNPHNLTPYLASALACRIITLDAHLDISQPQSQSSGTQRVPSKLLPVFLEHEHDFTPLSSLFLELEHNFLHSLSSTLALSTITLEDIACADSFT